MGALTDVRWPETSRVRCQVVQRQARGVQRQRRQHVVPYWRARRHPGEKSVGARPDRLHRQRPAQPNRPHQPRGGAVKPVSAGGCGARLAKRESSDLDDFWKSTADQYVSALRVAINESARVRAIDDPPVQRAGASKMRLHFDDARVWDRLTARVYPYSDNGDVPDTRASRPMVC